MNAPDVTPQDNHHAESKPMGPKDKLIVLGILSFIAIVAGIVTFDVFEDIRLQNYAHAHFVPVQAKVLESSVKTRKSHSSSNNRTTWHPYIYYRFEVDGKGYRSKRYSYSYKLHNTRRFAEEAVARYPAGAQVTAYYNPDNPKKAVLDNARADATMFYGFMALFAGIYAFIAGVALRAMFPRQQTL